MVQRYKASLHFCSECNNLLYPKADPQRRIMVYACRICEYDEIGENKCVYRNDLLTVTKCVLRSLAFSPLSVFFFFFFFSCVGNRRESRLTSALIRPWCVPFASKTTNHIYRHCFIVTGSLEHVLPKLWKRRVLIRFVERHRG